MKVYVCIWCYYDDIEIERVFDSESKAVKYIESEKAKLSEDDMKRAYFYRAVELE